MRRASCIRSSAVSVWIVGALVLAHAQETIADKDLACLQGTWKGISYKEAGSKTVSGNDLKLMLEIKGNKFVVKDGDKVTAEGTLKLYPDKMPKWMDMTVGKLTLVGIYEVDGHKLKLCYDGEGKVRPQEFKPQFDTAQRLVALTRQSK